MGGGRERGVVVDRCSGERSERILRESKNVSTRIYGVYGFSCEISKN